jgi:hypothetical protein
MNPDSAKYIVQTRGIYASVTHTFPLLRLKKKKEEGSNEKGRKSHFLLGST